MADEMLFTMAGSVATPAQMVSLEEAGLANRADLQEWLAANPEILGPAVKIVTFDLAGPEGAAGPGPDRLSVLGLDSDGRLVVAELKWGRASDVEVGAIKLAAQASRLLPESLADHFARFHSRHQMPLTAEGLGRPPGPRPRPDAGVVAAAPDRPVGPGLLARAHVERRLAERGRSRPSVGPGFCVPLLHRRNERRRRRPDDLRQAGVPPPRRRGLHHQSRAGARREAADSKKRVQDASTVRRLVSTDSVADGTIFSLSPRSDIGSDLRAQLEEWLHEDPVRRTAHWQNRTAAPLVWDADKASYSPAALVQHIVEQATGVSPGFLRHPVVA